MLIEKYHQKNLKKKEKEITAYSGFRKKKKKLSLTFYASG